MIFTRDSSTDIAYLIENWNRSNNAGNLIYHIKTLSGNLGIELIGLSRYPNDSDKWLKEFRSFQGVKNAYWDMIIERRSVPNDSLFKDQWNITKIKAEKVWDISSGGVTSKGDTIVVALLDFGFDFRHIDISNNIWVNYSDTPGDGIDNDRNGYKDDVYGWNFIDNTGVQATDDHGTAVAGIIGAEGNNLIGVSGINWNIKMMLCSIKSVSDIIEAYSYVIFQRNLYNKTEGKKGAFVVCTNASFGISGVFCDQYEILTEMFNALGKEGILTASAVGNNSENVDIYGDIPSTCPSPFLISVLASDNTDQKTLFSGYGPNSIDLGAPGILIPTTFSGNQFNTFSGTSAAAPQLCGAIALLYSLPCNLISENAGKFPAQVALNIKNAIIRGVTSVSELNKYTITGGVLNIGGSAEIIMKDCADTASNSLEFINLYPNPFETGFVVEFSSDSQDKHTISIYNSQAQLVHEEINDQLSSWKIKRIYIETDKFPKGIYFICIENGNGRIVKKIILY